MVFFGIFSFENFSFGEALDKDVKKELVQKLVYAKVILPSELFDLADDTVADDKADKNTTSFKTVPLSRELMASIATQELQNLQKVTEEISALHIQYQEEYDAAYKVEKATHTKDVKA
ncbi:hypothetical protein KORDIASMS9_01993 [Kordia sp. SMS9]|uniref:hypothetical protein n=1 Tax=Kordia sp. SMS9 TaxID=2282170 RepID=UPI000E100F2B|nr:hypothetical protein [Kordia sp. SMS9]AXG69766.1 hypothetical protein KORDIASMS9_01993 [Kordia sp. SMS9]